ncbi:hypothetical protein ACH3XW_19250 [Acanthocheilonema viteae]|uniref:Uncharacterized protein n=1 Tax=Acanthocheilonema viteae TaxID=6277 RepID=A0A498SHT2_ACAVI|nr:unnamed protein product [Acanthocheilonema viteae]
MAAEANDITELLNCIKQFETTVKSGNDEAENWRQCNLINEQKIRKFAKVKQKLQCALKNSEQEVSRMREKVRKAKKEFDYCEKQIAEYIAAIEAARCEHDELKRETEDFNAKLSVVEGNILESIFKTQIQIYRQTQEEKKRIDAKLGLLGGVNNGPRQEDVSAVQMHSDTLIPLSHLSLEMCSQGP